MSERFFNFCAGPATIPLPVMQQVKDEFLSYQGLGASLIEISHHGKDFKLLLEDTAVLLREILNIPADYQVLFVHGGGQMQFSAVPLNLLDYRPQHKSKYIESGVFSTRAIEEARLFGQVDIPASSKDTKYDHLPTVNWEEVDDRETSYIHLTSNNTIVGTQWKEFPRLKTPLVADMTSDICSYPFDVSKFGLIYAGAQKNLGASGLSIVIIRDDLLGKVLPKTPLLLNYTNLVENPLLNTPNTFAIYVANLILKWLKKMGGVKEMQRLSIERSKVLYQILDRCESCYRTNARPIDRSLMNVTFYLRDESLREEFITTASQHRLHFLKGHPAVGGLRASIYNGMSMEGVHALAEFLEHFAKKHSYEKHS